VLRLKEKRAMKDKIKSFHDLRVWKQSIDLVKLIYEISSNFPNTELYSLTSQMRRSAISVPSNIAEGFKRSHAREFRQFLNITLGSLAELDTQVIIAAELSYMNNAAKEEVREKIDHVSRMTYNLRKNINHA